MISDTYRRYHLRLLEYARTYGHSQPRATDRDQAGNLRNVVAAVRLAYQQGQLTPQHIALFQALPGWDWQARSAKAQAQRSAAELYHALRTFPEAATASQNRLVSKYFHAGLLEERISQKLQDLPGWRWQPAPPKRLTRTDRLKTLHQRMSRWAKENPNLPPRRGHRGESTSDDLAIALTYLRQQYRQGRLSAQWIELFEQIPGWTWHPSRSRAHQLNSFAAFQARVVRWMRTHPGQQINTTIDDGKTPHLGRKISYYRARHRRGEVDPEIAAQLEAIPSWQW